MQFFNRLDPVSHFTASQNAIFAEWIYVKVGRQCFYRIDSDHAGWQAIRMWNRAADGMSSPDFTDIEFDNISVHVSMVSIGKQAHSHPGPMSLHPCPQFEPTVSVTWSFVASSCRTCWAWDDACRVHCKPKWVSFEEVTLMQTKHRDASI